MEVAITSQITKVRDAQLAANDPSNTIISVDTRPYLRAPETPPGTRADIYHQNAGSYLDMGNAIGKAMLGLHNDNHPLSTAP